MSKELKNYMPFLSSLDNLLWDAYIIFQKGVDKFWDSAQNMLIFGKGCSTPLTSLDNRIQNLLLYRIQWKY